MSVKLNAEQVERILRAAEDRGVYYMFGDRCVATCALGLEHGDYRNPEWVEISDQYGNAIDKQGLPGELHSRAEALEALWLSGLIDTDTYLGGGQ